MESSRDLAILLRNDLEEFDNEGVERSGEWNL